MIYGESLKYNQRNLLVQWFINIQYIDKFLTYALRFQIFNKQWNLRKFGTLIKSTKYGPNFEYVYNHRNLLLDLKAELVLKLQQSCYFFIWRILRFFISSHHFCIDLFKEWDQILMIPCVLILVVMYHEISKHSLCG